RAKVACASPGDLLHSFRFAHLSLCLAYPMSAEKKLERLRAAWFGAPAAAREDLVESVLFEEEQERFWLVLGGHMFFQSLSAGARLDLLTLLSRSPGLTRAAIASQLGLADKPVRILLLGCAALRLLRKEGDRYFNAPMSERLLVRTSPRNILSFIELEHHII